MRRELATLISVLAACAPAAAAPTATRPFTIEQVLGAPFPSELVAAPTGGRVAWVMNARGVRNVWVAGPPDWRGRAVTAYTEDDGQELGEIAFTPDGRALVYVRGGSPNRAGEYPNPRSAPEPAEQAVWTVAIEGGTPRRIGEGHSPAVARGRVAFLRKGHAFWAPLDGNDKPEPLVLFKARGRTRSLRWSPDDAWLAFVSARGDHSYVGVYGHGDKTLRYLDPGVDRDGEPAWSPDSRRLAFIRIPASRKEFTFGPQRTAEPWSIRMVDLGTGRARVVWKADRGPGSAFWAVHARSQLLWAAGDRLVFPWEKTGWLHLFSVPADGGTALALTSGAFEVEDVALDRDGRAVVVSSNQGDIDRRHLWRVPVSGGRVTPLTTGPGIEWSPISSSDGRALAFLRSDSRRPAHAAVIVGSGPPRELAPGAIPADFPAEALVAPEPVVLPAVDGMAMHAQLFRPPGLRPGERRPALVFLHGGSRRQMLLGFHPKSYYHHAYALNQYLASRGFVVLAANYRSGTGYGLDFREAMGHGSEGASELGDVLGAGIYLRARADVDPARIGLWGGSYGGYLTALGLAKASHLFAAGVDLHGVHDWNVVIRNFAPGWDPAVQLDAARRARESSPLAWVHTWRSPVLVIHGDDDPDVPFSETVDLVESLRKQAVEVEQLIFPDETHDFLMHARWIQAYQATAEFLERRLVPGGHRR